MEIRYPTTEAGWSELADAVILAAKKVKGPYASDVRRSNRAYSKRNKRAEELRNLSQRNEQQAQEDLADLKKGLRLRAKALENRARGDKGVLREAGYTVEG